MRRPEDDDFTSAAESLLGIDLSSSTSPSGPIDLDDSDLFGEPEPVTPAPAPVAEVAPPAMAPRAAIQEDAFDDFGAGLDAADASPPPRAVRSQPTRAAAPTSAAAPNRAAAPARAPSPPPAAASSRTPPPERPEPSDLPEPPVAAVPAAPKDDSYWDALEGFDWNDDSPGPKAPEGEERPRGRSSDRSRRGGDRDSRSSDRSGRSTSRTPEQPSRQRPSRPAAQRDDDDFGGGLEEAPPSTPRRREPDPDVSTFDLSPSESQARYLDRDEPTDVSTFPLKPSESQGHGGRERGQRSGRPAPPPKVFEESDDFGAGIDERDAESSSAGYRSESGSESSREPAGSEPEPRRGRRRRGRGRGERPRQEERAPVESRHEPASVSDDDFDVSFGDLPAPERPSEPEVFESKFADVPTWAEAISLLVKGRPRTSDSSGGRSESTGGSERSGGGDRGRGRGRGGRGRGGRGRREQ